MKQALRSTKRDILPTPIEAFIFFAREYNCGRHRQSCGFALSSTEQYSSRQLLCHDGREAWQREKPETATGDPVKHLCKPFCKGGFFVQTIHRFLTSRLASSGNGATSGSNGQAEARMCARVAIWRITMSLRLCIGKSARAVLASRVPPLRKQIRQIAGSFSGRESPSACEKTGGLACEVIMPLSFFSCQTSDWFAKIGSECTESRETRYFPSTTDRRRQYKGYLNLTRFIIKATIS